MLQYSCFSFTLCFTSELHYALQLSNFTDLQSALRCIFMSPSFDRTYYGNTCDGQTGRQAVSTHVVGSLSQILFFQSSLNLVKIFVGIMSQPRSITSQTVPGIVGLWPFNYPKLLKLALSAL